VPGFGNVKTFLKVLLLLVAALLALKFLPLIFGLGCAFALAVLGAIAVGASTIVALVGTALVVAALLSPIWVPILLLVGVIALVKRSGRKNGGVVA
jgi:hypothetical protein